MTFQYSSHFWPCDPRSCRSRSSEASSRLARFNCSRLGRFILSENQQENPCVSSSSSGGAWVESDTSLPYSSSNMSVIVIPVLTDNYSYLLFDETTREAAAVDVSDADAIKNAVYANKLRLTKVLTTHHHAYFASFTSFLVLPNFLDLLIT